MGKSKVFSFYVKNFAERDGERQYYQVSASVMDPRTFAREIAPLKQIRDNYPKTLLTLDTLPQEENGIPQKNILEFLLES